jgi:putative ABC transport system permease protein
MNFLNQIKARLAALFRKRELDAEMDEELRSHIELRTQANIEAGMNPEEARFAALRQFGWTESIKETCREQRGVTWLENLAQDIRYGARQLRKYPGFTAVAVLTLALGVGANTAIFSVISAVLLRPLPYRDAERLVMISERSPNGASLLAGGGDFLAWREQSRSFESLAYWPEWRGSRNFNLSGGDRAEKLVGTFVSSSFFPLLGVQPILGRTFLSEEDERKDNPVVLISHALWQRHFGGDPQVLGRQMTLDNYWRRQYAIVGVLPPGFDFPEGNDIWLPAGWMETRLTSSSPHWFRVAGRLKPGVTLQQAQAELNTIQRRTKQQQAAAETTIDVRVVSLLDQTVGTTTRRALFVLFGAVGFLLLIACANIANLLLARGAGRRKELAIRIALGAGRRRIVRQLLTESLVLALTGGALGIALAYGGTHFLSVFAANDIPRLADVRINGTVLTFTAGVALFAGILFGLAPALQACGVGVNDALKESGRGTSEGVRQNRLRSALIVSEMALAFLLLVGAGLLMQSFLRLAQAPLGFKPENLLVAEFDLTATNYYSYGRDREFFHQLAERLKVQPGVQAVAGAWYLPVIGRSHANESVTIEGYEGPNRNGACPVAFNAATPGYFETMRMPILRGRGIVEQDSTNSARVAVINEALARAYFGNGNPIGKRLVLNLRDGQPELQDGQPNWREIVGVAANVRNRLDVEAFPEAYFPYTQWPWHTAHLVVRTEGNPMRLARVLRSEVQALNKDQPISSVRTMDQILGYSVAQHRFRALLLTLFSVVAVLLAAVGLYGVVSFSVTQRTAEFGIRIALGAQSRDILATVLKRGLRMALIGIVIGLGGALALTRVLSTLLYGVNATDPLTLLLTSFLLTTVALIACYLPGRRAAKVHPMEALRYE